MDEATANQYADEVVAAWNQGHAVLLLGRQGSGKTMIARRAYKKLHPLSGAEQQDVLDIYAKVGMTPPQFQQQAGGPGGIHYSVAMPPFRAPHHSTTELAMYGGAVVAPGRPAGRPGEVSLANHGVLYLDELPEFSRYVLARLPGTIKDKEVHLRQGVSYPADFKLIAGADPEVKDGFGQHKVDKLPKGMFQTVIVLPDPLRGKIGAGVPAGGPLKRKKKTEYDRMADFFFGPRRR